MSLLRSSISKAPVALLQAPRQRAAFGGVAEVSLIGRLVKEPEFLSSKSGDKEYAKYAIAVTNRSSYGKDASGNAKEPTVSYYDVVAFSDRNISSLKSQAERGLLGKGTLVRCQAQMERTSYTPAEGGSPVYRTNLTQTYFEVVSQTLAKQNETRQAWEAGKGGNA